MSERQGEHDPAAEPRVRGREPSEGDWGREAPSALADGDELPRQPRPLDPFTPEPGPKPGERRAWNVMRLAWIPVAVAVIAIVVGLIVR
jgi:hypothetical protein